VEEDVVTPEEIGVVKKLVEGGTWKADCEAKFMKVLSGHAPNEAALKMEEGAEPHWNALVKLVKARFPGQDPAWAREVVDNCKHFLNLKKEAKDWNSEKHFPSKAIDKVWHAHRSFPMRYQHDMLACCGRIIEPSLVLGKEVEQRCQEALKKHVTKAKTFVSEDDYPRGLHKKDFHNHEFWPAPKTAGAQCSLVHDCDLDDHCHFPQDLHLIAINQFKTCCCCFLAFMLFLSNFSLNCSFVISTQKLVSSSLSSFNVDRQ